MPPRRRYQASPTAGSGRIGPLLFAVVLVMAGCAALAAGGTAKDRAILAAGQRFLLFYSGVFALIALTAAIAAGLVATDRVVMRAGGRVISQSLHRAISLAAVGFLVIHIVTEILAHRSQAIDAVVPFLASGRTLYIGLGTLASDLLLLIVVTGVARHRFATARPGLWRAVHATAYLCWPLGILHGLLAGRAAKPYVDWSYGGCLAIAGLILVFRFAAGTRSREEVASHAVAEQAYHPGQLAVAAALASPGAEHGWLPGQGTTPRALPAGSAQPVINPGIQQSPGHRSAGGWQPAGTRQGNASSFRTPPSGTPASDTPAFSAPTLDPPQYGAPQYGAPQYGAQELDAPQYGAPQFDAPPFSAPQYGAPPIATQPAGAQPAGAPPAGGQQFGAQKAGLPVTWAVSGWAPGTGGPHDQTMPHFRPSHHDLMQGYDQIQGIDQIQGNDLVQDSDYPDQR